MALAYDEFDSRIDAIVAAFKDASGSTLRQQLPHEVTIHKGPYRENEPSAGNHAVFISRQGVPEVAYDMGTQTADVTLHVFVAASSYSVREDSGGFEGLVNIFAANVTALLFSLAKRAGDDGWYKGIWKGSVSDKFRNEQSQTVELEVFVFDVTFEVNYV